MKPLTSIDTLDDFILAGLGWSQAPGLQRNETEYLYQLDLPGHDPAQISLTIQGNRLSVDSVRSTGSKVQESILLPRDADPSKIEATSKNGVLTIKVHRALPAQTKIPIKLG